MDREQAAPMLVALSSQEGFYNLWNWFDDKTWYPLGRVIGGTVYPVRPAPALDPAGATSLGGRRPAQSRGRPGIL